MNGRLLHDGLFRTLMLLSVPSTLSALVQILIALAQIYYVGLLGTEQLAALTLVSPFLLFMQFSSLGDVGGALSAAVARAQGGGRSKDLQRLALYALAISTSFGLIFAAVEYCFGKFVYRALGGKGTVLDEATLYGHIVFCGSIFMWTSNLLAANLRGRGEALAPSTIVTASSVLTLPLYPMLMFGFSWIPGFGLAGAAVAFVSNYVVSTVVLICYHQRTSNKIGYMKDWWSTELTQEIIRTGSISSVRTLLSTGCNLTTTFCVGQIGTTAIAGYGIASRLDFTLVSLLYGLGISTLAVVGANIGAGNAPRAYRAAGLGTLVAVAVSGTIGVVVSIWPNAWLLHFSSDDEVLREGGNYLRLVGLAYAFWGCASALIFVSQAIGQMRWSFWGTAARFVIIAGGAVGVLGRIESITMVATLVAGSYVVLGLASAVILHPSIWKKLKHN
jgi:putative MATE family efflux protein